VTSTTIVGSTTTTTKPPTRGLTSKQLGHYLLTVSDMPSGWTSQRPSNGTSGGFCHLHEDFHSNETGSAEADFAQGQLPQFSEELGSYQVAPTARFLKVVSDINQCTSLTVSGTKLTLGRMSFPTIGTMSAAYQATGSVQGINIGFDLILALKRRVVIGLVYTDVGTPDVEEVAALARKSGSQAPGILIAAASRSVCSRNRADGLRLGGHPYQASRPVTECGPIPLQAPPPEDIP
jgi:hypothetical protein